MKRFEVVRALSELVTEQDLFVCCLGDLQHDWWNLRPRGVDNTLTLGILGSISSTALGLAIALPHRRVVALETDGSMLMNTGILCTLGKEQPPNLTVIVFDNGVYESIGGPPTLTAFNTDLAKMAVGAGCTNSYTVHDIDGFGSHAKRLLTDGEFGYLVAKIEPGKHGWAFEAKKSTDGIEDKYRFMRYIERLEHIIIHHAEPSPGGRAGRR